MFSKISARLLLSCILVGKLNLVEFARATPLRGGGGVDTFWNVNLATPITGLSPPTIFGAQLRINTQPVSYSLTVFDAQDATNKPLFSNLFSEGVNVMGTATFKTQIAGKTGVYGIKGIYSNKEGPDFSQIVPSLINGVLITKKGSYFVSASMQQYLIQDSVNPARGWGVFAEYGKSDGNPNTLDWSAYVGLGGSSLIPGRPDDRFGAAYFRYAVSDPLKTTLAPVFNLRDQSGVELFYNLAVTQWFRVTGNIQFIRPASGDFPNSIYAGLGTYVRF
jgi:porin